METKLTYEDMPDAAHEAVHAARDAAQAVEVARQTQLLSFKEETKNSFVEAIQDAFGDYKQQGRFVDLKQIPLICAQIINIHNNIEEIVEMMKQVKHDLDAKDEKNEKRYVNQDQFFTVRAIAYGFAGAVLMGFVYYLISGVFPK